MTTIVWRKSSYSSATGTCVEVADTHQARLLRNSVHPDAGTLTIGAPVFATWLAAVQAGDLDDLT